MRSRKIRKKMNLRWEKNKFTSQEEEKLKQEKEALKEFNKIVEKKN